MNDRPIELEIKDIIHIGKIIKDYTIDDKSIIRNINGLKFMAKMLLERVNQIDKLRH